MKSVKRIIGGRVAQKRGSNFEFILRSNCLRYDWECIEIPSGCKTAAKRLIRIPSPFDMVFVKFGKAIFCDAKTTLDKSFGAGLIKEHQVFHLEKAERNSFKAGYIVNFTNEDKTVWFHACQLRDALKSRKGLTSGLGIYLGTNVHICVDNLFKALPEASDS